MQGPVSFYPAIFAAIFFIQLFFFFSLTSSSHINDVYGVQAPKTRFFLKKNGPRRKHPFLLALRHWGRFARRNVVPPLETSPAAKSEKKRMFLQAILGVEIVSENTDFSFTIGRTKTDHMWNTILAIIYY